jgi:hypothetical protein
MRASSLKAASLLMTLTLCYACATRRTVSTQNYRLVKIGDTDFLLPPDFYSTTEDAVETPVPLGRLNNGAGRGQSAECAIRGRWFSLTRNSTGNDWVARVPAPKAWYSDELVANSLQEWNHFLAQIVELESKGCISAAGYETAINRIRESLPTPIVFASLFRGTLDERGFVPLKPGIRFIVERSVYGPPGTPTTANYEGDMKVYYRVVREHGDQIRLQLHKVQRSAGLSSTPGEGIPDTKLAHGFRRVGALRLFLLTWHIPSGLHRTALLIGVQNPADMMDISRKIEKVPEIPCSELAGSAITCVSFGGADSSNSASVELNIGINGREQYFPINATIGSVLSSLPPPESAAAWKTLHIRRLFRDKHYDLEFRRDDPEVSSLVLFPGDQISWGREPALP